MESPENKNKLEEAMKLVVQIKPAIFEALSQDPAMESPSVAASVNSALLFLDSTYLWLNQLNFLVSNFEQTKSDAADAAVADGTVVTGPGA